MGGSIDQADDRLRWFWHELQQLTPPSGISGYALGHTFRNEQEQNAALAAGTSQAAWGESAHNFDPSYAIDVYPLILVGGRELVSNNPDDYAQIASLAAELGLDNGGTLWGWDWPHVAVPGWRELADQADAQADAPADQADDGIGFGTMALALAAVGLVVLS